MLTRLAALLSAQAAFRADLRGGVLAIRALPEEVFTKAIRLASGGAPDLVPAASTSFTSLPPSRCVPTPFILSTTGSGGSLKPPICSRLIRGFYLRMLGSVSAATLKLVLIALAMRPESH